MKKALMGTALCACLFLLAPFASAQLTSIDAIQYYNPATGAPASPFNGQTVTVAGRLYVQKGTYNSGTHYLQGVDGGIQFFSNTAPALVYGDSIQVTGTVSTFSGEIQISPVTNITFHGNLPEPQPTFKTINELLTDYENVGSYVATQGFIVGPPTGTTSKTFLMHNAAGDTITVFVDSDTGIDVSAVGTGDFYEVRSPCVNFNTLIELKPRRQSDLIENPATPAPVIDNVAAANWTPLSSTPIAISATITDGDGTITSARLYYRNSAGDSLGAFSSVAMSNGGGGTWTGTIPTPHNLRQVDYYLEATDNDAQTTKNPAAAPNAFYSLAIGFTPIYTIQYVHPDSVSTYSPLFGKCVNVDAIVTYGTGEAGAPSRFVIQDKAGGPYTGLFVYEGSGTYGTVLPGDRVQIGGTIDEFFAFTELQPFTGAAVQLVSFGNDLPPPMYARTRDLADNTIGTDGNGRLGEQYEAGRVRTMAAAVVDTVGAGNYIISDTGARADSVLVDPLIALTYQPILGDNVIIEGWMDYSGGMYRLRPVRDEDIISGLTGVGDTTPQLLPAGGFVGIAPNPFNPKTQIEFALTRPNLVQLNVYNLRGQLVRKLAGGVLETGSHQVEWDGTDGFGSRVASGTYFARLRIGTEVLQVQKMQLVK